MTTANAEVQFALHLQRRLFDLLELSVDEISGIMLSRDVDTSTIRLDVVRFGHPTQHFIIANHEHQ